MLWSRIIVESNTAYDQCSDSNNLKLQRSRSAASSLRRRFGKISSRRESYRADPELLQRFGRLFSPPDVRSIISGCGSHARQSLHQSQFHDCRLLVSYVWLVMTRPRLASLDAA